MGFKGFLIFVALLTFRQGVQSFALSLKLPGAGIRTHESSSLSAASLSDGVSIYPTSRRDAVFRAVTLISTPMILANGLPANADVSDGNSLPQGAAQFGRVVKAKADIASVSKRVSSGGAEMDKAEWDNVGQFLRKIYSLSEDMKSIASGLEPEKKKKATALIDDLKKNAKAADAPTGSQNAPEFLAYARKITGILDEFMDLLYDVPDEL